MAQLIASGNVPDILRGKQVWTLDLASLVAGSKYRGEFEDRMKRMSFLDFSSSATTFFMESTFLGVVIFGRKKVGPKFYLTSAWLVFLGALVEPSAHLRIHARDALRRFKQAHAAPS